MTEQTLPRAHHANLHFVTPTLAIGGDVSHDPERAALQLDELRSLGVTHIVDCRVEWDDSDLFGFLLPHVAYLHHGMDDAGQAVPASWFEDAVSWVEAAGPDVVVLTHCHMGINRGPSLGLAVLLAQGWDVVEAMTAIRSVRPQANIWYAADAVRWAHGRAGTDPLIELCRLEQWRQENPLDVMRMIRQARQDGA